MPSLTAAQASRLMCALDPFIFKELTNTATSHAPEELLMKAWQLQQLAEAQNLITASAGKWLDWADEHGLRVHAGFRLEVQKKEFGSSLSARAAPLLHESNALPASGPTTIHRIKNRARNLDSEIGLAQKNALIASDVASVWTEVTKLAEAKIGGLIGLTSEGVQYMGKRYQETGEPDIFTRKQLADRMRRDRAR